MAAHPSKKRIDQHPLFPREIPLVLADLAPETKRYAGFQDPWPGHGVGVAGARSPSRLARSRIRTSKVETWLSPMSLARATRSSRASLVNSKLVLCFDMA